MILWLFRDEETPVKHQLSENHISLEGQDHRTPGEHVSGYVDAASKAALLQSGRADVLVHIEAMRMLENDGVGFAGIDWVSLSNEMVVADGDVPAAEVAMQPDSVVEFAPGGGLIGSVTVAARAILSDGTVTRIENRGDVPARSLNDLASQGVNQKVIRALVRSFSKIEDRPILIGLRPDFTETAAHKAFRSCYEVFYESLEFVSEGEAESLGATTGGSVHLMCARSSSFMSDRLLDEYADEIHFVCEGETAREAADLLFFDQRVGGRDANHRKLVGIGQARAWVTRFIESVRRRL